ncbi:hypothetical protein D0S45_06300 [Marinifilum sp. JC120]|nr:hypothetical protein D0S45_06300 [Marinifilum sp. JC120]
MKPTIYIRPITDERFLIFLLSICFVLICSSFSIAAPGDKKWEFLANDSISANPAIGADGTIYVGDNDKTLYAINSDGTKKWEFLATRDIYSSPALDNDGTIYVGSNDNILYAINPDGTKKWEFSTGNDIYSSPAIDSDGIVYVGSMDDRLYAINPDGTKKWEFVTTGDVFTSPAINKEGIIYVGSHDKNLYAINPDGTKKWEFLTGNFVLSSPAIGADGTIYVGSDDKKLYAINPDGTKKWEFLTGEKIRSSPAVSTAGIIYVGSYDYKLYAINPDGTKKWEFVTGDIVRSSPSIDADETIYVGSFDKKLYAINPDGTKKWEFLCSDSIKSASSAIGADGTIYIGSMDHKVYAIEGSSGGLADSPWPKFRGSYKNVGRKIGYEAQASPTQASGVTVRVKNCCAKTMTEEELNSKYSLQDHSIISSVRAFNASINVNGGCATFKFNSTAIPTSTILNLRLIKFYDSTGSSANYRTYAASGPEYDVDGSWWLTNSSGSHMAPTDTTTLGDNYYVYFVIRDNGNYDEDSTLGKITDPVGLSSVANTGCVLNPNADFSVEWIFMGIIAAVLMFRRKFMN